MLKFGAFSTLIAFLAKNGKNHKKSAIFVPVNRNTFIYMIDTSAFQGKTAAYFTLGCKLNFSETSTFGKILQEMGVRTAQKGEEADICLINTCSVTEVADHKCRQAIHRMVRNHPKAFVVVTGCYAQLEADEVAKIEGESDSVSLGCLDTGGGGRTGVPSEDEGYQVVCAKLLAG